MCKRQERYKLPEFFALLSLPDRALLWDRCLEIYCYEICLSHKTPGRALPLNERSKDSLLVRARHIRSRVSRSTQPRGRVHQCGQRVGFHLLHDLSSMRFNRDLADAEFRADLFIQQAGHDQPHDLLFAWSK